MMPPELCIKHRCYSAMACNGWGYCRERNEGVEPTAAVQTDLRAEAAERRAKEEI